MKDIFTQELLQQYQNKHPILTEVMSLQPVVWLNPNLRRVNTLESSLDLNSIHEAEKIWERFASFIIKEFPNEKLDNGILESPIVEIKSMKNALEKNFSDQIFGRLFLKCDHKLPIAGSVKARGGFYEVLKYAETLAIEEGLISKTDNYELFSSEKFKEFFSQFQIGVGSTGNLGLSIGMMSAKLGFNVSVYMSEDAKEWKKDLLKKNGVTVYEFAGDFSVAIATGREETEADPMGYFVDDENSEHLFLGYSTAAIELKKQLDQQGIKVDKENPLFVYLPCGVGGSPGGITFGLKQIFGDHVHCFFVEPVQSPAVLIGLITEEKHHVSVQDFGLDNKTEADGLAVGRPSKFASSINEQFVSGMYTIKDSSLFYLLKLLAETEEIYVEPSATAGLIGPIMVKQTDYIIKNGIDINTVNHIVWATGGGLVPEEEMQVFLNKADDSEKE